MRTATTRSAFSRTAVWNAATWPSACRSVPSGWWCSSTNMGQICSRTSPASRSGSHVRAKTSRSPSRCWRYASSISRSVWPSASTCALSSHPPVTSLSLYEDLLAPGEELRLPAGARIVYVASGELAGLHPGAAAFGADEATVVAGSDGATVLRWELTEWSVDDAKLSAHVELDPWADYVMRCERGAGRAAGPGIACVLRGELTIEGDLVTPFGAWVEPAELSGGGTFVRVVLVRAEEAPAEALAQGPIHL